jgi:hypothetical protein
LPEEDLEVPGIFIRTIFWEDMNLWDKTHLCIE